jgi:uncharacterized protein (DUF885 family)
MNWLRCGLMLAIPTLAACAATQPSPPAASSPTMAEAQDQLEKTYFAWFPEIATFYGVPESIAGAGYAARLSPRSPSDETAKRAEFRALLKALEESDDPTLSDTDLERRDVIAAMLRGALAPAAVVDYGAVFSDWGMWFVPYAVTQLSGP